MFDTLYDLDKESKRLKYANLVNSGKSAGYRCELVTIEVGSRGFISTSTVTAIKSLVPAKKSDIKSLLKQVIRTAIIKSNAVWQSRNSVT